jgi:hypothetical protein
MIWLFDKNSLLGELSIGDLALCVKAKRFATYGGSGSLYRSAVYESAGMGQPDLVND